MLDRIVTLIDMDCFYCQVEARLNPYLKGKPLAVVQYNKWKGGGIIAVNYEARDYGVNRSMRGDEARKKCADIQLVHVPEVRGKADLTKYRDAGREVVDVLCQFSNCVERASVDEAYIDITQTVEQRMSSIDRVQPAQLSTTFVVGFTDVNSNDEEEREQGLTMWLNSIYESELQDATQHRLAVAGVVVEEMRHAVFKQTGFRCSAGIAHNKILGKLACGLHKPNRQSILPLASVAELFKTLPVRKVRNLGGKFGCFIEEQLGCKVMADLLKFSENQLQQQFDEKSGTWLYNIARGIDHDPVTQRLVSKSIGCCKKFPGRQALATKTDVQSWLSELAAEVAERLVKDLEENKRRAKLLTVSYHQASASSRSGPLTSYDPQRIAADAYDLIKKSNTCSNVGQDSWNPPLKYLGLAVGKFVDESLMHNSTINDFFKVQKKEEENKEENENLCSVNIPQMPKDENTKPEDRTYSTSNSFFMRYLKQNEQKKTVVSDVPVNKPVSDNSVGSHSDDDMFESPVTDKKKIVEEKPTASSMKPTMLNFGASTSLVQDDSESNDICVSLSEMFPDLGKIDDDVVALLPALLQERLKSRLQMSAKEKTEKQVMRTQEEYPAESPDSWFVGGRTQITPKDDPDTEENMCNESEKQKDATLLSKSKQNRTAENLDLTDVCDDDTRSSEAEERDKRNCENASQNHIVMEKCPHCNEDVLLNVYPEHLDFHAAEELDRELNRGPVRSSAGPPKKSLLDLSTKRKRGRSGKKSSVVQDKKIRSITTFFARK